MTDTHPPLRLDIGDHEPMSRSAAPDPIAPNPALS
jgi:hypothetical protein